MRTESCHAIMKGGMRWVGFEEGRESDRYRTLFKVLVRRAVRPLFWRSDILQNGFDHPLEADATRLVPLITLSLTFLFSVGICNMLLLLFLLSDMFSHLRLNLDRYSLFLLG